jgi:hypothetical protein
MAKLQRFIGFFDVSKYKSAFGLSEMLLIFIEVFIKIGILVINSCAKCMTEH